MSKVWKGAAGQGELMRTRARGTCAAAGRSRSHVVERRPLTPAAGAWRTPAPERAPRPPPCPRRRPGTTHRGRCTGRGTSVRSGWAEAWGSRAPRQRASSSWWAGCPGKSDATWPSGPTPSITTSNRGTSPPSLAAATSSRSTGPRRPRHESRSGPSAAGTRGSCPGGARGGRAGRPWPGCRCARGHRRQVALVTPPDLDPPPVDGVPRRPGAMEAMIAEPIEPPVSTCGARRGRPGGRAGR